MKKERGVRSKEGWNSTPSNRTRSNYNKQQPLPQQHQQYNQLDRILKNVSYLPVFTGVGDITINSFLSSAEYLLSTIGEESLKKEAIKAIYYRNIQGEAKNVVINVRNQVLMRFRAKSKYLIDEMIQRIIRKNALSAPSKSLTAKGRRLVSKLLDS
ncbi:hypothetical protein CVS40_12008 [Lucilia cuprina]|nr:hypothetical protein CVS40_12008 [Lucilia cuprina]